MKQILVLQRRWAVVGTTRREGPVVVMSDGAVIRRWGTTQGLGELVNGPTPETVLDPLNGDLRVHELGIVFSLDVNQERW